MLSWLTNKLTGGAVESVVKGIGNGIGNVMDRFWPKKLSEAEKWEKAKDLLTFETEQGKLEVEDVNKARDMWMTFLQTQSLPWLARFMNGIYRPFCGFTAILYLTDQFWAQLLTQYIPDFYWTPIKRDPVVDALVAVIIYFFFGYRQRSKEKGVGNVG